MVISTVNQVVYNGDGITTAWPYTFRIIDRTDIKLTIIDADGTETDVTADYFVDTVNNTVYYPGYAPGAEPPLEDQPPVLKAGQKIVVYRELPLTQEKYLGEKWPFNVIELALDKLTMILQQLKEYFNRCLQLTNGAWDAQGYKIINVDQPSGVDDAASKRYVDNLISSIQAIGSNCVICNTVADMQSNADLVPGLTVVTKGNLAINDNRAGVYVIRSKRAVDVQTARLVFLNNNNVAERIANIGLTNIFYIDSDGYVCQED